MLVDKFLESQTFENEEWKEINGSDRLYFVSNYGRIKSMTRDKVNGRIMKAAQVKGFQTINIKLFGKQKTYLVHKIVAEAFIKKEKSEDTYVIHLDFNVQNNHISNLEWVTRRESYERVMSHLNEINKNNPGKVLPYSKLKPEDVSVIKSMINKGIKQKIIAKMFCISEMQITRIKRGDNWPEILPAED
jgi:hypothetical protein